MGRENKKTNKTNKEIDFGKEDFAVSIGEATGFSSPCKTGRTSNEAASAAEIAASARQFTLHRESSGRGGRIVTAVSTSPEQSPSALETLAKAMRKGLGCGSHVEGKRIILQGDIQERTEQWLSKHGAGKVVMGN